MNERTNSITLVLFCLKPFVLTVTIPLVEWDLDTLLVSTSVSAVIVSPAKTGAVTVHSLIPSIMPFLLVASTLRPSTMERISNELTTSLPLKGGFEKFFFANSLLK